MLANALGNTSNIADKEETYLIQQGGNFVNEYPHVDTHGIQYAGSTDNPNHLLGTFSCLFPYGFGGFEIQWPRTIFYEAHAKWSMKYANKRFHKDLHFMFQVFGVIQRWQVCRSAILQVHKKTFHENEASFTRLTPEDLVIASHEEAQKIPPSNPTMSCANALSCQQEFSALEVVSYLVGWGDRYISHHFKTLHWYSVVSLLK